MANSTPAIPVPPASLLSEEEKAYLKEREDIVVEGLQTKLKTSLEAAIALYEIHKRGDEEHKLWRHSHPSYTAYCKSKWGYEPRQAYRQRNTGEFLSRTGIDTPPANARQVQELITDDRVPAARQVECWNWVVAEARKQEGETFSIEKLKGKRCDDLVWKFLAANGLADAARLAEKKAKQEQTKVTKAVEVLRKFADPGDPALPALLAMVELELTDPERFQMDEVRQAEARSASEELKNLVNTRDAEICSKIEALLQDLKISVADSWVYRGTTNYNGVLSAFGALNHACEPISRRAALTERMDAIFGPKQAFPSVPNRH